jgi:iron complex transport system substrate-binding protein
MFNMILLMRHYSRLFFVAVVLLALSACTSAVKVNDRQDDRQAQLLTMEQGNGFTLVTVANPWKGGVLHRYVLVPRDAELPHDLPEGTIVRTPVKRALVYSSVHTSLLRELGAIDAVRGIVDRQYFVDSLLLADVDAGQVADCGNSMNPTVEKVIDMQPDAILLSPYQDASYGQITQLDIPIIECADYLEYDPLGRAEWMKFYGLLVGQRERADSLYDAVVNAYDEVKQVAAKAASRPTVVTEMVISGVWSVPGGQSYMARIIRDAGGDYLWADDDNTGSLSLDFNQVLARAQQADYWFLKWTNINSLKDLQGAYELNKEMEAFKNKRVYVCDTEKSRFFDRVPFHPDLLLREFAAIMHPELFPGVETQMYHHID